MVILYAFPERSKTGRSYFLSYAYIYPYFHQSWSLFVPPPRQNFNLYVRYKTKEKRTDWSDLFAELNTRHQSNRFAGEATLLAFSNALRYYATSAGAESRIFPDLSDLNFSVLQRITEKYLIQKNKEPLHHLEMIVVIHDENGTYAHYYRPAP